MSSGTLRPTFAATTYEYRAAVQYNVRRVTVTATAATGVTVEYLDATDITLADADTGTNGHQVDLAVGETAFKVKVTSGAKTEDLHGDGGAELRVSLRLDSEQGHQCPGGCR